MRYILLVMIALGIFPSVALSYSEQIVPNNIVRIGAEPGSQSVTYKEGVDIDIAVIDTGIDYFSKDLNVVDGVNCAPPDKESYPKHIKDYMDWHGHGTGVSGIIAAEDNGFGVVGVAPGARLYAVRAFNDQAETTVQADMCAIQWIMDHPEIDVVNMSSGWVLPPTLIKKYQWGDRVMSIGDLIDPRYMMMQKLIESGVTVVVAAGNIPVDVRHARPAGMPETISVSFFADYDGQPGGHGAEVNMCGTQTPDDSFYDISIVNPEGGQMSIFGATRGYGIDVTAPGVCVLTLGLGDTLHYYSGSSFSAPHVAGVAALYLSCHENQTPADVEHWLKINGEPTTEAFLDPDGYPEPIVNARRVC